MEHVARQYHTSERPMLRPAHFVAGIAFSLGVALSPKTSAVGPACLVRGKHVKLQDITVQPRGVEVGELGAWLNVQSYGEGVLARGWIRRSTVKPIPPGLAGRGWGCSGGHRHTIGWAHRTKTPIYAGPAKIPATTKVYAKPGEGAWATVAEDIEVQVRYYAGDTWAQLSNVPGVWSGSHAYVPVSAVVIPNVNADR